MRLPLYCLMVSMVAFHVSARAAAADEFPDVDDLPVIAELPDPLVMFDGTPVTTAEQWRERRRPELIGLIEHYMFGKAPPPPENFAFTVDDVDRQALGGKATRKLVTLTFGPEGTPPVSLLLVVPNDRDGPSPVFIGLNFVGNHTTMHDPAIPLTEAWVNDGWSGGSRSRAEDDQRGLRAPGGARPRWYMEKAVDRGYAVATMYAGEISPDTSGRAFTEGVHRGYMEEGQTRPGDTEWHTIAAWAWGLSRGVDYLVEDDDIDAGRIAVMGHSRLGKTALLAGAFDERFTIVIPSQSGSGGAAPARDISPGAESLERVNRFTHWFNANYKRFNGQVERLPFDAHSLIALCAPRPVLLTNATGDRWADPPRQFDALVAAAPVYELLGVEQPLATRDFPEENALIDSTLGYFIRPGRHDMTDVEWNAWLDFADRHWGER